MLSEVPHAIIESIDYSEALKIEGVDSYFDVSHLENLNKENILRNEEKLNIFAKEKVNCVGEIIAIICATSQEIADRAGFKIIFY